MSIHRTLKINKYDKKRSVRSRNERVKKLLENEVEVKSIYNLPKEKVVRLKIKKEKKEIVATDTVSEYKPPTHKKTSKDVTGIRR